MPAFKSTRLHHWLEQVRSISC